MHDDRIRVLIVDDEENCLRAIKDIFDIENVPCITAQNVNTALNILEHHEIDIVLTDVKMPGESGMELLYHIKQHSPHIYVILMTGYGSIHDAVKAMKLGAYQYVMKPIIIQDLMQQIKEIFQKIDGPTPETPFDSIAESLPQGKILLGKSDRIRNVAKLISKIANTDLPVLILGESGTGKELAATAIHYASNRADHSIVALNCAAFPESLLESELFGYAKGAFTDARTPKTGKFDQAHGGTLFLDEIGDMRPTMQVKLLRVLEEKEFQPLGSNAPRNIDFRLISATNKDLSEALKSGEFRNDLYYRLNAVTITMPPLREIPEDIPVLSSHFAKNFEQRIGKKKVQIHEKVMQVLMAYSWPGNVRELANCIRRAVALCDGNEIRLADLPSHITSTQVEEQPEQVQAETTLLLADMEKNHILQVLEMADNNKSLAANMLGIHRDTLLRKLKKFGIS
ncbi:response regulator [candidate division KSB1 bacterium]|jgi:two-component system response regulator HydG|nr:response regulator [candidate division KSB1 bacterium]